MISVRRHLSKNRPGLPQKSPETPRNAPARQTLEGIQGPRCAAILTQVHVVTPLGCGRHCATPFFTTASMPFWLADASKRDNGSFCTVLFSVLFCVYFHATHFIASPRSPGIGRLPETVKHLAVSPCPLGMGLRSGLTVYFEEEIEAFVFLFLQHSTSSTGSLRQSLQCTPAYWLDFLSYLSTDSSLFQSAPDPSGGRGEMAMVAPCCLPLYGTACAVGLI